MSADSTAPSDGKESSGYDSACEIEFDERIPSEHGECPRISPLEKHESSGPRKRARKGSLAPCHPEELMRLLDDLMFARVGLFSARHPAIFERILECEGLRRRLHVLYAFLRKCSKTDLNVLIPDEDAGKYPYLLGSIYAYVGSS